MIDSSSFPCTVHRPRSNLPYSHVPLSSYSRSPSSGWLTLLHANVSLQTSPPSLVITQRLSQTANGNDTGSRRVVVPLDDATVIHRRNSVMITSNDQSLPATLHPLSDTFTDLPFTVLVFVCPSEVAATAMFDALGCVLPKPSDCVDSGGDAGSGAELDDEYDASTAAADAFFQYNQRDLRDVIMELLMNDDYRQLTEDLRKLVREDESVQSVLRDVWGWDGS